MKEPGRVGSSAIRGAGFDFKTSDAELICSIASGHGENIIERTICGRSVRKLKKHGFIENVNKFLKFDTSWDLGLVNTVYDTERKKGEVSIIQTSDAFLYGFITGKSSRPVLQYDKLGDNEKYV